MKAIEWQPDKTHVRKQSSEWLDSGFHGKISVGQYSSGAYSYSSFARSVLGNLSNNWQSRDGIADRIWSPFPSAWIFWQDIFSSFNTVRRLD